VWAGPILRAPVTHRVIYLSNHFRPQSKECQKSHWKTHKINCNLHVQAVQKAAALGPEYSSRIKAMGKWCDRFGDHFGTAVGSALNIMNHPERVGELSFNFSTDK
jgi:hypothetical protein